MADSYLSDLFPPVETNAARPLRGRGRSVPCDECGKLHYRKRLLLIRGINPKRRNPAAGMLLCSRACRRVVEKRTHITNPCLRCGTPVSRRRSQVKKKTFCSKFCADNYQLLSVKCCWPGCETQMPCRQFDRTYRGVAHTEYKTDLVKTGSYTRYVVCAAHRRLAEKYAGPATRLTNGKIKLLADPDAVYDVRACGSRFMRAVLFERAGCACETCRAPLRFDAPPKTWQVDHVVPFFRGGQTRLSNLRVLCRACHDAKTAVEKADASRERHVLTKAHRWKTHHQKDEIINRLRARLKALGAPTD